MDSNLIVLLVSGTVFCLSAGTYVWLGKSAVKGDELQRAMTEAVSADSNVTFCLPGELPLTASSNLSLKLPEEVVQGVVDSSTTSAKEIIDSWGPAATKEGIYEIVSNAIVDYRDDIADHVAKFHAVSADLADHLRVLEAASLAKADWTPLGSVVDVAAKVEEFNRELQGLQELYNGDYHSLLIQTERWCHLRASYPNIGGRPDVEKFLGIDPATSLPAETFLWGLTSTELILVVLFVTSATFFISGVIYRYKQSNSPKPEDGGDEPLDWGG
jgi:hypothetical protein